MTTPPPIGLLLVNVGTPDAPRPAEVRRYLAEFLMDKYVIDLPWPLRALLVHGIVLRTRPAASARAYQKVWTAEGSPLLVHLRALVTGLQSHLDQAQGAGRYLVQGGMRYGSPSITAAFQAFARQGVQEVRVLPLYPQYARASTLTTHEAVTRIARRELPAAKLHLMGDFYAAPEFIRPSAAVVRESLGDFRADHVLFSFHSLPEKQVQMTNPAGTCFANARCCDTVGGDNRLCYRAQCYATAREIAAGAGLEPPRWSVSFQSRLGRARWITPELVSEIERLARSGVKRLAIACPSFVADCLETVEEVAIRAEESFLAAGGEALRLVPCVNSRTDWVEGVGRLMLRSQ